jgi:hypothetical protein
MGTVVALGGQVGGAKLADGLYRLRGKDRVLDFARAVREVRAAEIE